MFRVNIRGAINEHSKWILDGVIAQVSLEVMVWVRWYLMIALDKAWANQNGQARIVWNWFDMDQFGSGISVEVCPDFGLI